MKNLQINNPTIGAQSFKLADKAGEDTYIYGQIEMFTCLDIQFQDQDGTRMLFINEDITSQMVGVNDLASIMVKTNDGKYSKELFTGSNSYYNAVQKYATPVWEDYPIYFPFTVYLYNKPLVEIINEDLVNILWDGGTIRWTEFNYSNGGISHPINITKAEIPYFYKYSNSSTLYIRLS